MSEYQFYDFRAVDRPLTRAEQAELRQFSSRARITPTRFTNDYAWGSFKGDEDAWMERYFDAHLYLANWGTRILKLRLPSSLLSLDVALTYCGPKNFSARSSGGWTILDLQLREEWGTREVDVEGYLDTILPVRDELARGDLRALYLAWLSDVEWLEELMEPIYEPPVPPGLGELTPAQEALARFLKVSDAIIQAAAEASPSRVEVSPTPEDARAWVERLPVEETVELITRLLTEPTPAALVQLRARLATERAPVVPTRRRTVEELTCRAAELKQAHNLRVAQERALAEEQKRERAERARRRRLDRLIGQEEALWDKVERLVALRQAKKYDAAIEILNDLKSLKDLTGGPSVHPEAR